MHGFGCYCYDNSNHHYNYKNTLCLIFMDIKVFHYKKSTLYPPLPQAYHHSHLQGLPVLVSALQWSLRNLSRLLMQYSLYA